MSRGSQLENFPKMDEVFKALSSRARFNIVAELIKREECNVSTIVKELEIPQPTVSQHLTVLKNAGIIEGFRKGTQIFYKVVNKKISKIIDTIQTAND